MRFFTFTSVKSAGKRSQHRKQATLLFIPLSIALCLAFTSPAVAEEDPTASQCADNTPVCKYQRCAQNCAWMTITDCESNLKWIKCQVDCVCQAFGQKCDFEYPFCGPEEAGDRRPDSSRSGSGSRRGTEQSLQDKFILNTVLAWPFSPEALFLQATELLRNKDVCNQKGPPETCGLLCSVVGNTRSTPEQVLYSQLAQAVGITCPATSRAGSQPIE